MRRRARRLDDLGEETFGTCRGGDGLGDVFDEGLAVEASGWKGRRGTAIACDSATLTFYRHVARWAGENGWLLLTMLRVDRRMVAFSFGFDHHDVVYGLKIGYDERHAKLSPGLQLIHRILNLALAGRTRTVDMLGADDPYKRTVADGTRERITADWFAPTWSSRAAMVTTTAWVRWRRRAHRVLHDVLPASLMEQLRTAKAHARVVMGRVRRRRTRLG